MCRYLPLITVLAIVACATVNSEVKQDSDPPTTQVPATVAPTRAVSSPSSYSLLLDRIGQTIGFVGAVIMFIWGPPQPDFSGDKLLLESTNEAALERRRWRYVVLSHFGMGLVAMSFVLQLTATFA